MSEKISKRVSDAMHFFELQPQIWHFLSKSASLCSLSALYLMLLIQNIITTI